ncbi:proteasomal ubiquitin receptor ADRM1-B isoform X2 [Diachasma alloeum]|uniref:proteasomal ubiquitin receptor ADRM1-B isoform X1 n=1 Tax=Diachasma alloeum TaxID=454923 RepID=UPI0007383BE9|nr:proteasomal ubiquitin receptor ADRM1-B isoform X1 [Diachasma alloeum]XP_015114340.1 proteasomal ubiquitin receptor ADRM1-B isoform X2 [Diachasma alloeum]
MSGGALFSNNAVRGSSKNLVEFKAGKMTVKGKMVYPDTRKGLLYVFQSDDSLMHLCWKDRTSGTVEDDLIIFPDDCEFKHVSQCKTGRVYLLKFKLSSKKFFFWLQDLKTDKDEEHCRKINEVLNNPPTPGSQRSGGANPDGDLQNLLNNMSQQQLMQLFGGVGQIGLGNLLGTMRDRPSNTRTSTTTASTPVTTSATRPPAAQTPAPASVTETPRSSSGGTPKNNSGSKPPSSMTLLERTPTLMSDPHLFDLQRHLWNISTPPGAEPVVQRGVATELTNTIPAAITATESLERTMSKHLPPGDSLCTTLSSPQFSQALSMFWSALQSGQASPVVRQFGLGADAVNAAATGNLEEFVSALEGEGKSGAAGQAGETEEKKAEAKGEGAPSSEKKDDGEDPMALD